MKRRINILKFFVIIFVLMIAVTACTQSKDPETSYNSTSSSQSPEASSSTEPTESNIKSNKQIVDAIYNEIYGIIDGFDVADAADFAINEAKKLPDRCFGKITSEEDAKEKAEAAWVKIGGAGYTDDEKPYEAKYYKEYDAWLINGTFNAFGTDSSGIEYATPGGVDFMIIRASNGEVLAVWGEA